MKRMLLVGLLVVSVVGCGKFLKKKENPSPQDAMDAQGTPAKVNESFDFKGELEEVENSEMYSSKAYTHMLTRYYNLEVTEAGEVSLDYSFAATSGCDDVVYTMEVLNQGEYVKSEDGEKRIGTEDFDSFYLKQGLYKVIVNALDTQECSVDADLEFEQD